VKTPASYVHTYRRADGRSVTTHGLNAEQANDRLRVLLGFTEPCYELPLPLARVVEVDDLPLTDLPLVAPPAPVTKDEARAMRSAVSRRMAELSLISAKARLRGIVHREVR